MTKAVIVAAARTPVGSFLGSFANIPAHDLGAAVLQEVVSRAGIDPAEVSETILGQVLTAGQGQNPARQAHINAGLPAESGLASEPSLRVWTAGRCLGRPAGNDGRCHGGAGGRPGKHVDVHPCGLSACGPEDG